MNIVRVDDRTAELAIIALADPESPRREPPIHEPIITDSAYEVWGKVMFSMASVILSTIREGGLSVQGGLLFFTRESPFFTGKLCKNVRNLTGGDASLVLLCFHLDPPINC